MGVWGSHICDRIWETDHLARKTIALLQFSLSEDTIVQIRSLSDAYSWRKTYFFSISVFVRLLPCVHDN